MKTVSNVVYIKRLPTFMLPGETEEEHKRYIGGSLKGGAPLRGLSFEEEKLLLSDLIGVSPVDQTWAANCKEYWKNIKKEVPAGEGLKLEVGFEYDDIEKETFGEAASIENRIKYGKPINTVEYILYRYCLVYSKVANDVKDARKSPNIEFFISSKKEETKVQHNLMEIRRAANKKLEEIFANEELLNSVLAIFNTRVQGDSIWTLYDGIEPDKMSKVDREILLETIKDKFPNQFMTVAGDKDIVMKAFIQTCINNDKLTKVPNTSTIMHNGRIIGYSLEEVVAWLSDDKNVNTLHTLQAQVRFLSDNQINSIIGTKTGASTKAVPDVSVPVKPVEKKEEK